MSYLALFSSPAAPTLQSPSSTSTSTQSPLLSMSAQVPSDKQTQEDTPLTLMSVGAQVVERDRRSRFGAQVVESNSPLAMMGRRVSPYSKKIYQEMNMNIDNDGGADVVRNNGASVSGGADVGAMTPLRLMAMPTLNKLPTQRDSMRLAPTLEEKIKSKRIIRRR